MWHPTLKWKQRSITGGMYSRSILPLNFSNFLYLLYYSSLFLLCPSIQLLLAVHLHFFISISHSLVSFCTKKVPSWDRLCALRNLLLINILEKSSYWVLDNETPLPPFQSVSHSFNPSVSISGYFRHGYQLDIEKNYE